MRMYFGVGLDSGLQPFCGQVFSAQCGSSDSVLCDNAANLRISHWSCRECFQLGVGQLDNSLLLILHDEFYHLETFTVKICLSRYKWSIVSREPGFSFNLTDKLAHFSPAGNAQVAEVSQVRGNMPSLS
nr:PREDICTED: uncharacterized protein LOC109035187 isoform X3 [Bemisia tabaci]